MSEELLAFISKSYGLDQLRFVRNVTSGYLSLNMIIRDKARQYFLKQYRFDNTERVQNAHAAKFFFAKGGVPIILPLLQKNNASFFLFANHYYALFPFVRGRVLKRREFSAQALQSAATMLANLHGLSRNHCPQMVSKEREGWDTADFVRRAETILRRIEAIPEKTTFDKQAEESLRRKLALVQDVHSSYEDFGLRNDHLTHGDYHNQNLFFNSTDNVTHVFDVEKTERAPRLLELLRSMDFICFDAHFASRNFACAARYLRAYQNVYPFGQDEIIRCMRAFFWYGIHSLWVEEEHYARANTRADCFLEPGLRKLTYMTANKDAYIQRIQTAVFT